MTYNSKEPSTANSGRIEARRGMWPRAEVAGPCRQAVAGPRTALGSGFSFFISTLLQGAAENNC